MHTNPNVDRVDRVTTEARVSVDLSGIPDVGRNSGITISPSRATLTYMLRGGFWRCHDVRVSGFRVLKPGKDGERRVSDKSQHTAEWHCYGRNDLAREGADRMWGELPAELRQVVEDMRPVGPLQLPPVA